MLVENLKSLVAQLEREYGESPRFTMFPIRDENPLSGHTKRRIVFAPNNSMLHLQREFLGHLRSPMHVNEQIRSQFLRYATAALPKSSPLNNALIHRENRFFYLVDFRHAYRSVLPSHVADTLIALDEKLASQREELVAFLIQYFFHKEHGLVTGGPASQDLFNLSVGSLLDGDIGDLCEEFGITYTRYIDDLTFSSPNPIVASTRRKIRILADQAGFIINHWKSDCVDLTKRPVVVTGIGIAEDGRIFVPRAYFRRVRGALNLAMRKGEVSSAKIQGMMSLFLYIAQFYKDNGLELNQTEKKLLNTYHSYQR
ncbi:MAG: hypothetical protein AAB407_00925 [Patescibacteria group bacterium]